MKIENIKASIVKAQENVKKREASVERNIKQLAKLQQKNESSYEIKFKQDDIISSTRKLEDAKRILRNWEEKLQKELDKEEFINSQVPEVIKEFLENWKNQALEWHLKRYDGMVKMKKELDEATEKATEDYKKNVSTVMGNKYYNYMRDLELDYNSKKKKIMMYAGQTVVSMGAISNKEERDEWIENLLEREKQAKIIDLINRINKVAGEIVDASEIEISPKGNLDGIIKGSIANVKIETIGAGGFNIQCFHYRTLIKPQK